jgi:hypothetical protein
MLGAQAQAPAPAMSAKRETVEALDFFFLSCFAPVRYIWANVFDWWVLIKQMVHRVGTPIRQVWCDDVSAGVTQGLFGDGRGDAGGAHAGRAG